MIGIIDIGSNTVRLNVYLVKKKSYQLLISEKEMAGLVNHIEDGKMTKTGIQVAVDVLTRFETIAKNIHCHQIHAFATASLRNIKNSKTVLKKIYEKTGIKITLLSGETEAHYGFLGALEEVKLDEGLLIDIGGGSTELVVFKDQSIVYSVSIAMASLNSYINYVEDIIATATELANIKQAFLNKLIESKIQEYRIKEVIAIGGTARATFKLLNETKKVSANKISKLLSQLSDGSKASKIQLLQQVPDRIHTFLPGLQILTTVLSHFESETIYLSNSGVREGYLIYKVL